MLAMIRRRPRFGPKDRKSTRLNSSHTVIYTLSLHDALPISCAGACPSPSQQLMQLVRSILIDVGHDSSPPSLRPQRSEEHTSELQSHSDLHSFPTRRSSDLLRRRLPQPESTTHAARSIHPYRCWP